MLRDWGLGQLSKEQEVFRVWEQALGDNLAVNSRPVAVHHGYLVVAVKDSAWMQELQFMRGEIVKKLNQVLGKGVIREVRFKLGSWDDDRKEAGGGAEEAGDEPFDPGLIREAEEAASVIADPRLREQVIRTLVKSASREEEIEEDEDE